MRIVQVKDGEAPAPSPPKSAKSASKSVRAIKDFASSSMGLKSGKGSFAAVSRASYGRVRARGARFTSAFLALGHFLE